MPKSEIVTAFELLLNRGVDREDLNRELLTLLGLKRPTKLTAVFLDETRQYVWRATCQD